MKNGGTVHEPFLDKLCSNAALHNLLHLIFIAHVHFAAGKNKLKISHAHYKT